MSLSSPVTTMRPQLHGMKELCRFLGGKRPIERLLIANNGLAAVKGIDSVRSWLYVHTGNTEAVEFTVMATPEDLHANAEFISLSDRHVAVPGGPNRNNYANVDIIMQTAVQNSCNAIYPGWGHASENPALPRECVKTGERVIFLGPSAKAMFALGDKIASTIVAQSNGVPTVPWSGDEILLPPGVFEVDPLVYEKAYISTAEECEELCGRLGFPVMIKASEGGGGKGIRRCLRKEDVRDMFFAVAEEVKGCHIFVMRMLENVRHLEVQLLADDYGDCIAVHTRDCSVQRRHQKIIEEGPVFGVDASIINDMEAAAVRLAKAVKYRGLGTVEYMYDKSTQKFFFLELNPRIQVEHPVSELVSGVNLPAALLCVGMGVPLHRIPEVRTFFGEQPYDTSPIDFTRRRCLAAKGHTIAVRVTAEDTDEGFRPTSGRVEEIAFKNSKECWGYFSVGAGGEIHQFADSQFGHIFSSAETREEARRGMVMALRNLVIRGEIHTSVSYVLGLLERPEFCNCDVSTDWLDRLISARILQSAQHNQQDVYIALTAACTLRMLSKRDENHGRYVSFLSAGHVPTTEFLSNYESESYVNRSTNFNVTMGLTSPTEISISLNGSVISVPFRKLKSGALQLRVGGKTAIAYAEKEPSSLRISIGGKETTFTGDIDPTKLFAAVPGRFVRYLVCDGGHVEEGTIVAEVEVMKMILPLRASTVGALHHKVAPGSTIALGTLVAEITPDDPSKVARPREATEPWPPELLDAADKEDQMERLDSLARARRGAEALWNMLRGYHFSGIPLDRRLKSAFSDLGALSLSSVSLTALNLPFISERVVGSDHATPNYKLRVVLETLISEYVEVERSFVRCNRQEAIHQVRETTEDTRKVFEIDFAHNQPSHHGVIKAVLNTLENNMVLLKSLMPSLSTLVNLRSTGDGTLQMQARYLLRQCSLPSFVERKIAFTRELEEGSMMDLIQGSYGTDLLCATMFDRQVPHLIQLCLEFHVQREYFGQSRITNLDVCTRDGCWYCYYEYEPLEEHDPLLAGVLHCHAPDATAGSAENQGAGVVLMLPDVKVLQKTWAETLNLNLQQTSRCPSVCTVFVSVCRQFTEEEVARLCEGALRDNAEALRQHVKLERVTFIVHGVDRGPRTFTYRSAHDWREDTLIRNVAPLSARRLELQRLENYDVVMYPTPFKEIHVFHATPKKKSVSFLEHRIFARACVTPRDLGVAPWTVMNEIDAGHMFDICLDALDVIRSDSTIKYPKHNHLFIKMVELTFDLSSLRKVLSQVGKSYKWRTMHLGVAEVELSFLLPVSSGYVPFRVIVSSSSGASAAMRIYHEWNEGGKPCLRRAQNSEDILMNSLYTSSDSVQEQAADAQKVEPPSGCPAGAVGGTLTRALAKLEALRSLLPSRGDEGDAIDDGEECIPLQPYPLLNAKQLKRLQAWMIHTVYVHDWPELLQYALREEWKQHARGRRFPLSRIPPSVLKATELYLDPADKKTLLEEKPQGHVPCGVIVWLVDINPPSYYDSESNIAGSRRFVMVANDITFQSGSFAVPEDDVFSAASVLARQLRIPFVYISANSGARIGLSAEVKKRFRVAFNDAEEVEYLYLVQSDYDELVSRGVRLAVEKLEPRQVEGDEGGEVRYVIRGVVGGTEEYLGVENLRGSGLIAGHMSKNYSNVPTISIVTGRSVGIGAYLNRIGRRVIQTGDAPLILTGAAALNRLLGKEVYSDNSQLGGRQVMVPNGVTHWYAKNNRLAAETLLRWLDYVPPVVHPLRCSPRILALRQPDPIDRDVTYEPSGVESYDPRGLVRGVGDKLGLFDRDSWVESLEGWAKTVVTGRATLGGIPCGIVLVETRPTRKCKPADPADPTSSEAFVAQAGQVWFPDSARKTADALDDFHRERLPCFIFANWRGFSGGMRDMFEEVLKFGASIVDNLRVYNCPVFIYIPPRGELRGGAWVVVDPSINHCGAVEMYCDGSARGGVLEAAGIAEIKFREADVRELIRRNEPRLRSLSPDHRHAEENRLLPRYNDVALRFADLHDTHVRMEATGVVRGVIPWKDSRRRFYEKLQRKLKELSLAATLVERRMAGDLADGVRYLEQAFAQKHPGVLWGSDDALQLQWLIEYESELNVSTHNIVSPTSASAGILEALRRHVPLHGEQNEAGEGLEGCFEELFKDERMRRAAMQALERTTAK
ncbi:acetyl-CoA carboxylase, putative [Trypanosoma brucei gambiense DAL972]|uniref:Acetyl-CoA carboxylase, putative n=1 Tax=Trypanosoma brucei gambiense (strain MHOM/CI/86/DAL972) TaxID=679716 RepID=C9ZWK0_TRYB9|nr:acetyl-CoA carboxylase, putative [Trypanosoma brucei gambiense DAL972]CBH13789.1 acetyl-CoA carboxylase, putative [Trypanosoma brucei gambiense DAL972]|eukprot:XP_011776065.1 acetyl-CoA carboxylase, putative [Trypanosoma brucei gambiense DAL972]